MSMPHAAGCINGDLDKGDERYQESREKERWTNCDAKTNFESNQQRRRRWFGRGH